MKIKQLILVIGLGITFFSCNKQAGPGGTSIIKGKLIGQNHSSAKTEITEVIFTNGNKVEHGDYWLLNTPSTNSYFYIWYDNPTWVSDGDPHLGGRTGIKVSFNYSDSNLDIANNTKDAIQNTTNMFDISILNDILIITNTQAGETPDATDVSTPFDFNIKTQGEDSWIDAPSALVGEKIYITYGNNDVYNDNATTGPDGSFMFTNLTKGDYNIQYLNKDTLTNITTLESLQTIISKNKSVIDLEEINVLY
jgi:hypothetical protein